MTLISMSSFFTTTLWLIVSQYVLLASAVTYGIWPSSVLATGSSELDATYGDSASDSYYSDYVSYYSTNAVDNDQTTCWSDATVNHFPDNLTISWYTTVDSDSEEDPGVDVGYNFGDLAGVFVISDAQGWIEEYRVLMWNQSSDLSSDSYYDTDDYLDDDDDEDGGSWIELAHVSGIQSNHSVAVFSQIIPGTISSGDDDDSSSSVYSSYSSTTATIKIEVLSAQNSSSGDYTRITEVYPIYTWGLDNDSTANITVSTLPVSSLGVTFTSPDSLSSSSSISSTSPYYGSSDSSSTDSDYDDGDDYNSGHTYASYVGTVFGIVLGGVIFLALVAGLAWWLGFRHAKKRFGAGAGAIVDPESQQTTSTLAAAAPAAPAEHGQPIVSDQEKSAPSAPTAAPEMTHQQQQPTAEHATTTTTTQEPKEEEIPNSHPPVTTTNAQSSPAPSSSSSTPVESTTSTNEKVHNDA